METSSDNSTKDGSAFGRCEGCDNNIDVALTSMHNCSLDAKINLNLEAQVVETQTEAKKNVSTSDEPKPPLTAFVIFMKEFRRNFRQEHLSSFIKDVSKIGAEKWKSMTEEEKKVYRDKAAKLNAKKSVDNNDDDEEEEDEEKQRSEYLMTKRLRRYMMMPRN